MKKRLICFCLFCLFFVGIDGVAAATSASIQVNSSRAILTITSNEHIGQVWGTFSCGNLGSKKLDFSASSSPLTSQSFTISFPSGKTGTYTCQVSNLEVGLLESNDFVYPRVSPKIITLGNKTPTSSSNKTTSNVKNNSSNKDSSKSSDNTLKSLTVEGQNLSFDKNTTNYSLAVSNEVKSIKINAEVSDSKASVMGTGEKSLKDGDNKFEIVVTAENGDKRVYYLNVVVDSKPIIVTIGDKEYTLVKNKNELPELSIEHEDLLLTIDEQEIPAYRIDKINYVLVALRDSEGNVKLYKFDSYKDNEKPNKYTLFRQFSLPSMLVSYLDFPSKLIPDGYKKYKEEIGGEKVTVYKVSKDSDYCLFYGINIETGEKNIYKYDDKEKTIQIYDREEFDGLEKEMQEFKYIIAGLIGLSAFLLIVIVIIVATRKRKFKKMIQKYENKKMAQL